MPVSRLPASLTISLGKSHALLAPQAPNTPTEKHPFRVQIAQRSGLEHGERDTEAKTTVHVLRTAAGASEKVTDPINPPGTELSATQDAEASACFRRLLKRSPGFSRSLLLTAIFCKSHHLAILGDVVSSLSLPRNVEVGVGIAWSASGSILLQPCRWCWTLTDRKLSYLWIHWFLLGLL